MTPLPEPVFIDHNFKIIYCNPMDFSKLALTQEQIVELNGPFTAKHAQEMTMLGFARALSEAGILPSEAQEMLKVALVKAVDPQKFATLSLNIGDLVGSVADAAYNYPVAMMGGGALLGAYTGYARHNAEQTIKGNENPKVLELKRKIDAYNSMTQDLQRSNNIAAVA